MKFCYCILFLIAQTAAGCALTPITPPSVWESRWAIAVYALLYVVIWQVVLRDWSGALLLKFWKREALPTLTSVIVSSVVLLFVFGLLILMIIIPENTLFIMSILTFFMAPLAGTILFHRLNCSWRTIITRAVLLTLVVLITGWIWAATMDNSIEDFFGKGSGLSRLAEYEIRVPGYDDPIPRGALEILKWRIISIERDGNRYCMRIKSYGWMRAPIQPTGEWPNEWTHCFGIVVHDALFFPETTELGVGADQKKGFVREQFRLFSTLIPPRAAVRIEGLVWRNGRLTLTLSPYNPLTDLVLEVIDYWAYDGKKIPDNAPIILTLFPSDAVTDKAAGTLTWTVEEQPWKFGDRLTLRIRAQRLPPAPP